MKDFQNFKMCTSNPDFHCPKNIGGIIEFSVNKFKQKLRTREENLVIELKSEDVQEVLCPHRC